MKTNIQKDSKVLILFIYLLAFVLMTWSFNVQAANATHPEVVITTSMGEIKVKLESEKAPISTANFLKYVEKKHYDGTTFHRVIPTFMIQGGGHLPDMKERETLAPIKNEAKNGLSNLRGTIAMARTNEVDSATSQFFINVVDNKKLDHVDNNRYGYSVFGEVSGGMDVVDKIRDVKTTTKGEYGDVPVEPVLIKSVRLVGAAVTESNPAEPVEKATKKAKKKAKGK